ncbi:MAG: DUF5682 family protein [Micrococcales bacterium]|nr:DUF5682 family protein [Micrococcales bacterium]
MISYFGVRHHGPGSTASLVAALDQLRPSVVLVEGPSDATGLLPLLADRAMRPPVALLGYAADDPRRAAFWPFAEFSPEYQAVRWALRNDVPVELIDLPVLAQLDDAAPAEAETEDGTAGPGEPDRPGSQPDDRRDPISALAAAAGYEDPESWWNDLIEQNPAPGPIFAAVGNAMAEYRNHTTTDEHDLRREAHMRRAIAQAAKNADGPVAVVCGALHVPALAAKHTAAADRALLTGLPRRSASITWAPWTNARLAYASGYGAGVSAPGWNQHLWQTRGRADVATRWLARIAAELRQAEHLVSTASLIEAERLAVALAALRDRPQPGFEELREAAVSCLFGGDPVLWNLVADRLLVGTQVGTIPEGVPLAPLIDDLQRQQRLTRLRPEALPRELALDLRTDSGAARSVLLHRLRILGVGWGQLTDAGRSRGTFRERWVLAWDPTFAIDLVDKLVYGSTVEQAAAGLLAEQLGEATTLGALATGCEQAMTAGLPTAVSVALRLLADKAALSSDAADMLGAIPPLVDVLRYGQARRTDAQALGSLVEHLVVEASLSLHYAARPADADASDVLVGLVVGVDRAIRLLDEAVSAGLATVWDTGLAAVVGDDQTSPKVAGCAAQLRYASGALAAADVVLLVQRRLSPGTRAVVAAAFLEGFFTQAAERLIYDADLRDAVSQWLTDLDEDEFVAALPLLRRVFADLGASDRTRLLAAALGAGARRAVGVRLAGDGGAGWERQLAVVARLLTAPTGGADRG